ncbi:hypothetical protein [Nocardia terpenica]|uniref:hypothetical protein n=1 Tax=Nocardia terpenica TaxID=455432 RepID=UPI0012FD79C5|nr:hypothetical protein [Nocardia terpenica]
MESLENPDMLKALTAARSELVERMGFAKGQPYAALFKMYLEVQAQIAALTPMDKEGTPLDELAQRRAKRQSDAEGSAIPRRTMDRG